MPLQMEIEEKNVNSKIKQGVILKEIGNIGKQIGNKELSDLEKTSLSKNISLKGVKQEENKMEVNEKLVEQNQPAKRVKRNASIKAEQKIQKQKEDDKKRFTILNKNKKQSETRFVVNSTIEISKTVKPSTDQNDSRFCGIKIKRTNNKKFLDKINNLLIFDNNKDNSVTEKKDTEENKNDFFCNDLIEFSDEEIEVSEYKKLVKKNTKLNEGYKTVKIVTKSVLDLEGEIQKIQLDSRKKKSVFVENPNESPHNENTVKGILKENSQVKDFKWKGEKEKIEIIKRLNIFMDVPVIDFEFCRVVDENLNQE